jgi:hypothetical protein
MKKFIFLNIILSVLLIQLLYFNNAFSQEKPVDLVYPLLDAGGELILEMGAEPNKNQK